MTDRCDIVIVGAGIIGLTTAFNLLERRRDLSIIILEKEGDIASHQTGHNSGVIHAGLYYAPGSLKAQMCLEGRERLMRFCDEQTIDYEVCGKVVVATEPVELPRLDALTERAQANGVAVTRLDRAHLRDLEPHAEGIAGLHVPSTGIVNYSEVCAALRRVLTDQGVEIRTEAPALSISERSGTIEVVAPTGAVQAAMLVNCAGLHSDRVAKMAGADTGGIRIMPFRGEYFELVAGRRSLCRNLIYPLPDPAFPFLGVHLTRMIDGSIHAGPNAVPALAREGYTWRAINGRDVAEVLRAPRTYRLAKKYWRTGAGEIRRSLSKRAFTKALQRLCPEITGDDLVPSHAGVRAQALDRTGKLIDDFAFAETPRAVHVVNAPSPAATASFAIGGHIATRALAHLRRE
ncbi:MAG TPA: L-2-hydroxyglutarate oxidase [Acidimicrobiales bacterium]|nr:L-2-hydroxyglutarate oxidase [Acidimicrobiales bacterium]